MAEEKQNGYTKYYNEILDLALLELSGNDLRLFFYIYRKTIGWQKKSDKISYSQIMKETNLYEGAINRVSSNLEKTGWITINRGIHKKGNEPSEYSIFGEVLSKQQHLEVALLNDIAIGTTKIATDVLPKQQQVGTTKIADTKEKNNKESLNNIMDFPEKNREIVGLVNRRCGTTWMPTKVDDMRLIKDISIFSLAEIEIALTKALKTNNRMKPPGIIKYANTTCINEASQKIPVDTRTPEEYNSDLGIKNAIGTIKSYKKQIEHKILKKDNALSCINSTIEWFEQFGENALAGTGTDKAYWIKLQEEYNVI